MSATTSSTTPTPPAPRPTPFPDDPVAAALAVGAAARAEISDPANSAPVAAAMQRLLTVQCLATALQDAVNDLRAHTTVQLAAVGAAASRLVATGDVERWRATVAALELGSHQAQQRLEALLALARSPVASPEPPAPPAT